MRGSDWEYVNFAGNPDTVYIRDLNLGGKSVTNDAEAVVKEVNFVHPGKKIIYQDSDGCWDELVHVDGRFVCFDVYNGPKPV